MNKPGNYVLAVIILLSLDVKRDGVGPGNCHSRVPACRPARRKAAGCSQRKNPQRSGHRDRSRERLSASAPWRQANRSSGDRFIDLPNATVLPGLTDAHTHLTGDPQDVGPQALSISIPRATLTGARNARLTLEAGFTTVRNVGAEGFGDVALRDAINAGDVPGPHMLVSGPALGITGGHCDENLLPFEYHYSAEGVADGVEGVQRKVREVIKYGADLIKICATGGVLSHGDNPQASAYTQEELKAIVTDAHRLGRKVAAHAHGAQGILWASQAGVDSIEHGSYIDDAAIAEMKKNGTYLVPTLYLADWFLANAERLHVPAELIGKGKEVMAVARKNEAHAFTSGVKVAFGTDAAVYPHGLNAHEFAVHGQVGADSACNPFRRPRSMLPTCWAGQTRSARSNPASGRTSSRSKAIRCRT